MLDQTAQQMRPPRSETTHFITLTTNIKGAWFVREEDCQAILKAFEGDRQRLGLECLGYVLMPDRLHALLYQSVSGPIVPQFVQDFKKATARRLHADYPGQSLWRMRYVDEPVPDTDTAAERIAFMHECPVEAGLVASAELYPWSSARDFAGLGVGPVSVTVLQ